MAKRRRRSFTITGGVAGVKHVKGLQTQSQQARAQAIAAMPPGVHYEAEWLPDAEFGVSYGGFWRRLAAFASLGTTAPSPAFPSVTS